MAVEYNYLITGQSKKRVLLGSIPLTLTYDFSTLPSWDIIFKAAKQYLLYCDCQPLPLFDKHTFLRTLQNREEELLFAVLGLALRFCDDLKAEKNAFEMAINFSESARRLIMSRITNGPVELSTLQSLCLLSLTDFTSRFYPSLNTPSLLI